MGLLRARAGVKPEGTEGVLKESGAGLENGKGWPVETIDPGGAKMELDRWQVSTVGVRVSDEL